MAAPIVSISHVSKNFRTHHVLRDITFDVYPGELVGLVGTNGSGKSTLLKILAGSLYATHGAGTVTGTSIDSDASPFVGLMLENPPFIENMTGWRNLVELAAFRRRATPTHIRETLHRVGLDPANRRLVQFYSQGMRQRLALAQAIMEDPPLLLLDEPLNGLDPVGILDIRYLLLDVAKSGTAVFFSSHVLAEVAELCDRILVLHNGVLRELQPAEFESAKTLEATYREIVGYAHA